MATVNLGSIRFNWKGAYNNSTAYVVNDVVTSSGNSYVCIQASQGNAVGNATAYWNIMSSAGTNGTNGTDVGTTLTTQGDILYRDGSGLQKLAAGTSGQFLKTQGSGANPVWSTADSGKTLGVTQLTSNTRTSLPNQDSYSFFDTNYTQIKANSKLIIDINLIGFGNNNGSVNFDFEYDGTTYAGFGQYDYKSDGNSLTVCYRRMINGASSTGAKNFKYQYDSANSSTGSPFNIWNPNGSDDGRLDQCVSTLIITEMDF
tara:strand:- start:162 stop:938 length:777 start_codon:yes stop_codon:yes gene_type:complete